MPGKPGEMVREVAELEFDLQEPVVKGVHGGLLSKARLNKGGRPLTVALGRHDARIKEHALCRPAAPGLAEPHFSASAY